MTLEGKTKPHKIHNTTQEARSNAKLCLVETLEKILADIDLQRIKLFVLRRNFNTNGNITNAIAKKYNTHLDGENLFLLNKIKYADASSKPAHKNPYKILFGCFVLSTMFLHSEKI